MKKTLVLLLAMIFTSTPTLAATDTIANESVLVTDQSGFDGPKVNDTLNTVEDVMNAEWLTDGMPVTIIGHITMSLGNDQYTFADKTGQMTVKIDSYVWEEQKVTPKDKVQIMGKIAKNDSSSAVIANSLKILSK
ncbi:YgiW/YdeI family stress tolerance OB fold protein [Vibrio alfacsensis]|uniref:YgiW/YdeI family stress tolerance OB fold protein n=1 Tax=Vibrio alfacsensis TaxID=1074311 RepID=UPI004067CFB4